MVGYLTPNPHRHPVDAIQQMANHISQYLPVLSEHLSAHLFFSKIHDTFEYFLFLLGECGKYKSVLFFFFMSLNEMRNQSLTRHFDGPLFVHHFVLVWQFCEYLACRQGTVILAFIWLSPSHDYAHCFHSLPSTLGLCHNLF
jgi:hypothetical protein